MKDDYQQSWFGPERRCNAAGFAAGQGLYEPQFEHDSCGVGFIAALNAEPAHHIVGKAVRILMNLEHRGAVGGDKATGDGAGLLVQLPHRFFCNEAGNAGFDLPADGEYGVGMLFLPVKPGLAARCRKCVEQVAAAEGCAVLGWRQVPVDGSILGEFAARSQPGIEQVFISRGGVAREAFERKLYVIRRSIEKAVGEFRNGDYSQFYIASMSSRTIVYKGMLTGSQLLPFFPDLQNPFFACAFAIVHQRYSTNTLPTWSLAQPFRMLAHNGEINTLRGNVNRMRARETQLASPLFGDDLTKCKPIIVEGASDSAQFDNVLELLTSAGRLLPHAVMMMVPEAWGVKYHMSQDRRAFYEYHSAIMEPWDGPAALAFTDGRFIGATLDRNGLRPARFCVTTDGLVVLASETGVLEFPPEKVQSLGRLQPGRMLLVDLKEHRIVPDHEIKSKMSRRRPYRHWVSENRLELRGLQAPAEIPSEPAEQLRRRQHAFGYSWEELKVVLGPMAAHGQEAVGSMGNDEPLAVLAKQPQLLYTYFKQNFAQVTNPPIDPLREELVMSLMSYVGRERNLLEETPQHCRQLKLHHPVLTPEDMARLRRSVIPELRSCHLDMLFPADGGAAGLEAALNDLFKQAEQAVAGGATLLLVSDREMDRERAPIPALLAVSGLHHHLIRCGLRTAAGIIVETGEAREVMHFAMLIGFGANAVCPYTALSTVRELADERLLDRELRSEEAVDNYIAAVKKGLLKTFSRMGISTIRSFMGAQIFDAVGLGRELVDRYFAGTTSRIGGIGLAEIAEETRQRHAKAFPAAGGPPRMLEIGGHYALRLNGAKHLWSVEAITSLQQAVREGDYAAFKRYTQSIDQQARQHMTLRSLFEFRPREPVALEEVEPVEAIVKRFVCSAMSFGSISREAHETLAIGCNRIGARNNSGEGGEDPARYMPLPNGDSACSRIKQIASGRFGVTTHYALNANELQIKIAQGAKPGEGGQLPGHKVTEDIARVRHTTAGVTLISPPPHHDIYSIEDIAQLIYDLKCVNSEARVSVKLVSEAGVGTVAAGVAKARADMVQIASGDGGTGASPLTAIKHCGLPWEIGLAETQQTLQLNGLRDKIRVQVDGQLRTGRDLAIAALLGAEEFGFATVMLVTVGCVMMRKCHSNTCPVGVATQDPELRKLFTGKPEHVVNFLRFIAEEFRERMAELGFRRVDEMVGHIECLDTRHAVEHWKTRGLDLSRLLMPEYNHTRLPLRCLREEFREPVGSFDDELIPQLAAAVQDKRPLRLEVPVRNINRTIGARLSGEVVRRWGPAGLPDNTISLILKGSAGQSLGAFLTNGITMRVHGDANDYLGKAMSGGCIVVTPPARGKLVPHENVIVGNVVLYGATGGEVYINGLAGERFCVRNSGASAVVEGVGDHGCEYMTGGTVVVLGPTGNNFAAGMSGGIAYVYDDTGLFDTRCNLDMVDLETVHTRQDVSVLREMLEKHLKYTGSARARMILRNWETHVPFFVKVMPIDYRRALERMRREVRREDETVSATEEVYDG
jgi:glutamate synthase (NADPH/NADH) large chain